MKDRIHGRYLAQIEILENYLEVDKNIWGYSGFLIISIDCMVIETLNQFYLGILETPREQNEKAFKEFFDRSQFFNKDFNDAYSEKFYKHIRNGLLHQAQTKKKSLINMQEDEMVKNVNPDNIEVVKF